MQSYDLEKADPDDQTFALRTTQHSDGTMDVYLLLLRALDRERKEFYSFTIRAYDGDRSPKTGAVTVDITVTDSNDNNPRFDEAVYEATVFENLPRTSSILRVRATDPDSGLFGEVVYSFADSTPVAYQDIFGLNNVTGEIYVKGIIDYEAEQSYQLTIQAKDKGPNSIAAFTRVNINVIDQNDLAPSIDVNTVTPSGEAEVKEHAERGTFVAHLSVQDPDMDGQQRFDCAINNRHFSMNELSGSNKEYTITTAAVFDREDAEQPSEYEILVECRDYGSPSKTSVEEIVVNIVDVNDHAPAFAREHYYSVIAENNSQHGAFIMNMEASDADSGLNAAIVYALSPAAAAANDDNYDEQNAVMIDPNSGVVTANVVFDYESRSSYQYIVMATDRGTPARSSSATLNVTIRDINDEYPLFTRQSCNLPVTEEHDPDVTLVTTFTATDRDDAPFNNIKYLLNQSTHGVGDFRLDDVSGALYTNRRLDREPQAVYHLVVYAQNDGFPTLRTTLDCTVRVLDVNDNPPVIAYPSTSNNTSTISNKLSVGSVVTSVVARDADSGDNAQMTYQIVGGNEGNYFAIVAAHGHVVVSATLEKIRLKTIPLTIEVRDHGRPSLAATSQLIVIVDANAALTGSSSSSHDFVRSSAMIALGVVLAVIVTLVIAIIVAACTVRRKRRQGVNKNKHIDCQLGNHEALRGGGGGSSSPGDTSMNSDSSANSTGKDAQVTDDKELTFTFDLEKPYLQQKPAVRPSSIETAVSECDNIYDNGPPPQMGTFTLFFCLVPSLHHR